MVERCVACQRCDTGTLVPLSDYGGEGATLVFKAWVCTNPACGFNPWEGRNPIQSGGRTLNAGSMEE